MRKNNCLEARRQTIMFSTLLLLVGIVFCLSSVSAWSSNTFNNSLTSENITFQGFIGTESTTNPMNNYYYNFSSNSYSASSSGDIFFDVIISGSSYPYLKGSLSNAIGWSPFFNGVNCNGQTYSKTNLIIKANMTTCINTTEGKIAMIYFYTNGTTSVSFKWIYEQKEGKLYNTRYLLIPNSVTALTNSYLNLSYNENIQITSDNYLWSGTGSFSNFGNYTSTRHAVKKFVCGNITSFGRQIYRYNNTASSGTWNMTIRRVENNDLIFNKDMGNFADIGSDYASPTLYIANVTGVNVCEDVWLGVEYQEPLGGPTDYRFIGINWPDTIIYNSTSPYYNYHGYYWNGSNYLNDTGAISTSPKIPAYNITYIPNNLLNPNLSINNDQIFSYNGNFNQSNNKTNNFANVINRYITATYLFGSNYIVPLSFYSDTAGILQYSDLQFNNLGFIENSQTYNSTAYETSTENYILNITYDSVNYKSVSGNLIYDGTTYSSTKSGSGNNLLFSNSITIPIVSSSTNKSFYWALAFTNLTDGIEYYNSSSSNQTINPIIIAKCNSTYPVQAINFSIYDETTQSLINTGSAPVTFQTTFRYWAGSGSIYKNYSYQEIASLNNSFQFCIQPNITITTDMDSLFSATNYYQNNYYLRGSTLNNVSSTMPLYLLPTSSDATKFTIIVQQGSSFVTGATVQIQKQFVGLGIYKTTGVGLTDSSGRFPEYLDLDASYQFIVIKDGSVLGTVTQPATCSAAPCSMTLRLTSSSGDAFDGYNQIYAGLITSNITFNPITKIVSYTFIDTTGTANYVRLEVTGVNFQNNSVVLCNTFSYSPSGTLTCNLSNYTGDFTAKAYISRSPEKIDPNSVFSYFIEEDVVADLGDLGVFLIIALIITLVFGTAVIARGSPSAVLFIFGLSLLILKLIKILPFSYGVLIAVEVVIFYFISKLKV